MSSSTALPSEFQQALSRGWTIVTANQRAARTLRREFDLCQQSAGAAAWQPPPIVAWDTWLTNLWRQFLLEGSAADLLLSPTQERMLWREVIAADSTTSSLRPVESLAALAENAHQLLHRWQAREHLHSAHGNSDTRVFARWLEAFERQCQREHYLTRAQLSERLAAAAGEKKLTLPPGLLLVGFDSKNPAQIALLDAVTAAGTLIESAPNRAFASSVTLASAGNEHNEILSCARWLREQLTLNPTAKLAVIVPSIEPVRAEIERTFREVLAPELDSITASPHAKPYEFSLGIPLAETAMAATALHLLHWVTAPLALERVSALVLSRYFASASATEERITRAEFDAFALRQQKLLQPLLSVRDLLRIASSPKNRYRIPAAVERLRTIERLVADRDLRRSQRTYAEWAGTMEKLLEAAGWALAANLDSVEFQLRRKWESALDELATLDFANKLVTFSTALGALESIAAGTLFAPESRYAPVQIMGPLESAGSIFDAIWFLRSNDAEWPAPGSANPLLPWHLQRELHMPGANPSEDAALARSITKRIAASAPTAIFSFTRETSNGPQHSSPALTGLKLTARPAEDLGQLMQEQTPIALERISDSPVPIQRAEVLRGGAGVLEQQAACAFRAFAEKRLFATGLESRSLGLDFGERGSIVHEILRLFWTEVQSQQALRAMPVQKRDAILDRFIDQALADRTKHAEAGWSTAYLDTERQRIRRVLGRWLDYEATERSPFVIKELEKEHKNQQIGPLHLDVRVDRIDMAVVNNQPVGEIILDYKTGRAEPKDWSGDRPDSPQLPLYAVLAGGEDLEGIAFASVRPGKVLGIKGIANRDDILPGRRKRQSEDLTAQVQQWRKVLQDLAQEFHDGTAQAAPKNYPKTCQYCKQRVLCRLDLSTLDADALDDESEEALSARFAEVNLG